MDRRLSAETITELVHAYEDGIGTPELRRRYGLSQGSVIKILHEHGLQMRNQGLDDTDVATEADLYRDGTSLTQLAERFGVSPNAVRRALLATGAPPRGALGQFSPNILLSNTQDNALATDSPSSFALPPSKRRRITARLRDEAVAAYESGRTSRQVTEELSLARSTVLKILKAARVSMRPQWRH